jgi:hypothetical protein
MTGFKVGSTLLAVTFACAMSGAAQAPAGDSLATRSMWALYVGYGEGAQFVAGAQLHLRTPAQPLAFVFTPKGGIPDTGWPALEPVARRPSPVT